jgi:hypothetical protein
MEILFALLIVLGIITVIGHGIWVLLAAIFRAFSGESATAAAMPLRIHEKPSAPREPSFCDHCGAALAVNSKLCFSCGRTQLGLEEKETLNDLDATERQLKRFHQQSVLDESKFSWLMQIVAHARQQFLQPPPAPEPVIAPEITPEQIAPIRIESPAPPPFVEPQIARAEMLESPTPTYQPPITSHQPPPAPPPPPRKSLTEMLAAFMEEKNIRWGELLGGLLIIGCSLALVISLWSQIEQIPLLKFFIFTAMTGAFAGLGFYSEHRWKLPNTSRGLLITATMLVPLNFLAIAAFAKDISASNPMVIASELISLALFVVMVHRAGKVITPGSEHWLTIGAVGTSAMQLILRRVAGIETSTITLCLLAALPIACYAVATFGMLRKLRTAETLEAKEANQSFTLLSASSFAAVVALGVLLFKTQSFVLTLERIAPMVTLLAIPALLAGIALWQRLRTRELNPLAILSTSIAVFSAVVMMASLVMAWPNVINVMIVAAINFAALSLIAFALRLPVAHLAALPCFVLVYLVGVNLAFGRIAIGLDSRALLASLFSLLSGKALAILFVPLLLTGEALSKRGRKTDGISYALVAAGVGALSLLLVSLHGFGRVSDPQQIAWVYGLFAACAFAGAWRVRQPYATLIGWGLAFLALVQFLHFGLARSFKLTTLVYATAALAITIILRRFKAEFAAISQHVALSGAILAGIVLVLTAFDNPASILPAQILWLAGLCAALFAYAVRERLTGFAFGAAILLNFVATLWYLHAQPVFSADVLTAINVVAVVLIGLAMFALERRVERRDIAYSLFATLLALLGVTLLAGQGLLFDWVLEPRPFHAVWRWSAVLATLIALVVNLWDATAKWAMGGLYLFGLVATGTAIDQADLAGSQLIFALTMSAAGYALLTSWLWSQRQRLSERLRGVGIPLQEESEDWLEVVNSILIVVMTIAAFGLSGADQPFVMRFFVALAVASQILSFAWLARGSIKTGALHIAALSVGLMGAMLFGWAFLPSQLAHPIVHRAVVGLLIGWASAEVFGLWFIKRFTNEWTRAARRLMYPLCGGIVLVLAGLLAYEIERQATTEQVAVPSFAIFSVAAILLVLSMQTIYFAVRAERDPLQLSERGRMNYVYVSEALLALAFFHIRLTMPWLFTGFFARYWPFVVMILAFVGVGLGEMFRRRGQRVLGEPLLNTGFFLPIFPVIGFWLVASKIDYSGLLLAVGVLYAVVAVLRSSFGVSLLACLAANGSLWYFLSRAQNFSLLERPQLWLTPAALSVLVAAYLNREQLSAWQMTNLRYITLSVIYVSSTAEIFVRGVAQSPWEPIVLMVLSAAGVLAGMLLRVRAFLYLGSSFLLISIVTMIWHASANFGWTWLWYVTGIIVGLGIILLFAMFEKKRAELLQLVEGLRTWEA